MNDAVLLELARRWDDDAKEPSVISGSDDAKVPNAVSKCERRVKRECADTLRTLVSMLGDSNAKGAP